MSLKDTMYVFWVEGKSVLDTLTVLNKNGYNISYQTVVDAFDRFEEETYAGDTRSDSGGGEGWSW